MRNHRAHLVIACLLAASLAGCWSSGPPIVPVSGKVVIDGQPLTRGFIRFIPASGRASESDIDSNGRFVLSCQGDGDGAWIGTHRIEVLSFENLGPTKTKWYAPKEYASLARSGLTQEIDGPRDDLIIELTWGSQSGPFVDVIKNDGGI